MKKISVGLVSRLTILLIATVITAQLINSVIIVQVSANLRNERAQAVAAERVVQGLRFVEVAPNARRFMDRRRGFRIQASPPPDGQRMARAEALIDEALVENGFDPRERRVLRVEDGERSAMVAGIQLSNGQWLLHRVPVPPVVVPWGLVGLQTLVLTAVLLIPALWTARVVAMPLGRVTAAAESFLTGTPSEPLPQGGPPDIDALCRAFEALEQRILNALEERSVMLGAIGHDLRTPLASLRIRVESVEDDELRSGMIASIEDLAKALDDILAFSSDIGTLKFEAVRTEALLDRLATVYPETDLTIVPSPSFRVRCAPESVLRALRNLIDNAVRYGENAQLEVSTDAGHVVFAVSDRGAGMPVAEIERLQQPFTRAEGSRNRSSGGSGLGLAIVRAVATAHQGDVTFLNRDGGGLEVRLLLPAERVD